ncbi:hypothetical protein H7I41_18590 [Mycobacterium manitobense]|uniref:Uncharacterized protein n=1 Tax=[Mycobacterium] manitobense TaxID=190147 RepID=A0A9X2YSL4_9MYCO|nr:hypothetical protein [[Mycobacterium] manitobense]MCV7171927.1 hypothetical protein [[Mycobacterium] manitobense]
MESYVAGEVAYLSSPGFARAVGGAMGRVAPATVLVTQNGTSPVLTITGIAPTGDAAVEAVDTAIDVYRRQLKRRIDEQLSSVLPRLDGWERSADGATDGARAVEVQNLREVILLQAAESVALEVVQTPTVDDAANNSLAIAVLFGGLVGGLLVILGLTAIRNRSNRLRSAAEVLDMVDGLIVPAVELRDSHESANGRAVLARTLYAQCRGSTPIRVIVVIGASRRSETKTVASLLEFAAAENGSVTRVRLDRASVLMLSAKNGGGAMIVDAGAIGDSALTAEAIGAATDLIVVGRLNVDTVPQILAVRSATASSSLPLLAVFTYRQWWSPTRSHNSTMAYWPAQAKTPVSHKSGLADVPAR